MEVQSGNSSPTQIIFVNHASIIIDSGPVRLITDPWLFGTAFDNGWAAISKSVFQIDDFEEVTHI